MLFNTLDFVIFFIIALTIIAVIKRRNFQHVFIIAASYFFLYYSSNYQITLLIFTILWTYYLAKEIHITNSLTRKKQFLILTLGGNLGLLGFFKYADFTIAELNGMLSHFGISNIPALNLILPIGISFYTFHAMGYVIDVYRNNIHPARSLKEYMFFVTFFPQLVAGPILRAGQFLPQLREKIDELKETTKLRLIVIESHNLKLGLTMMMFGFVKKMLFADNIAPLVNQIFDNPVGLESFTIILGAIAFAIQIYGDFSGYSDIAIGAALIMGFKIPLNFNKPYFALSPADFWRRWHISLSTWVRDYLYFPLVFNNRKSDLRVFVSLMTSFFFLGLWHGAGLNFAIYGILHGGYVSIETVLRKHSRLLESKFFKSRIGKAVSILITQYLVFLAFIAFRVQDLDKMFYAIKKYVILDFSVSQTLNVIRSFEIPVMLVILFIILHYITYKKNNILECIASMKLSKWFLFSTTCILLIVLFYGGNAKEFIYFDF